MEYSELEIQKALYWYYFGSSNTNMVNLDIGKFQADFVRVTKAMYIYEYEIKCTYSDFLAENKKTIQRYYHPITGEKTRYMGFFENGVHIKSTVQTYQKLDAYKRRLIPAPNYFSYAVVPDIAERVRAALPEGVGLMTLEGRHIKEIIKPTAIHKDRCKDSFLLELYRIAHGRFIHNKLGAR